MTEEQEYDLKMAAASLYAGGTDTVCSNVSRCCTQMMLTFFKTLSVISTFFLAMTLYPEAQQKAQHEIDTVIGNGRLPSVGDRSQLPYVTALYTELFRWNPTTPLGKPSSFLPCSFFIISYLLYCRRTTSLYPG